jgi:hypothetical protein
VRSIDYDLPLELVCALENVLSESFPPDIDDSIEFVFHNTHTIT